MLKSVSNDNRRSACHGDESDPGSNRWLGKKKKLNDIQSFVESFDGNGTSLTHHSVPHSSGNSERASMGRDCSLSRLTFPPFPDHNRFFRSDLVEEREKPPALTDSFEIHANDVCLLVSGEVIKIVTGIKHCRVPEAYCLANF